MTTDLWMLAASAALTWALMMAAATPTLLGEPRWALGNRDDPRAPEVGWRARWRRNSRNLEENLLLFAVLVLVVHVAGRADETSARGAEVFFWARLAYAGAYMAGIPYLRTLIWAISVVGMMLVASALL